jgi:hypothetical protein
MATITFRFTTECEMTLSDGSYEEIYLQFKDFMHGDPGVLQKAGVKIYPPESVQVFFNIGGYGEMHEILQFKGDYQQDISDNCDSAELHMQDMPTHLMAKKSAEQWRFW